MTSFEIVGLPAAPFAPLFSLPEAELSKIHARRVFATEKPGFPCRVSLTDAEIGEELLLLPYTHQPADSPYRASGPIFVRKGARQASIEPGVIPEYVTRRLISVRAYDVLDCMTDAAVSPGAEVAAVILRLFDDPRIAYIHLHNANRGCFSCAVRRTASEASRQEESRCSLAAPPTSAAHFASSTKAAASSIPNPWDVGSALLSAKSRLQGAREHELGLRLVARPCRRRADARRVLAHLADLAAATDVPLNADFENGFAADAAGVGESVRLAVETGVAGLSIEDSIGPRLQPPPRSGHRRARCSLSRRRSSAFARRGAPSTRRAAMCCWSDAPSASSWDSRTSTKPIARLEAYADAGADCLYAPGIQSAEHIRRVVEAVHPKPVNVLVMAPATQSLRQFAELGVRRVSVGGALARAAWGGFMRAAREIAEHGTVRCARKRRLGGELSTRCSNAPGG